MEELPAAGERQVFSLDVDFQIYHGDTETRRHGDTEKIGWKNKIKSKSKTENMPKPESEGRTGEFLISARLPPGIRPETQWKTVGIPHCVRDKLCLRYLPWSHSRMPASRSCKGPNRRYAILDSPALAR